MTYLTPACQKPPHFNIYHIISYAIQRLPHYPAAKLIKLKVLVYKNQSSRCSVLWYWFFQYCFRLIVYFMRRTRGQKIKSTSYKHKLKQPPGKKRDRKGQRYGDNLGQRKAGNNLRLVIYLHSSITDVVNRKIFTIKNLTRSSITPGTWIFERLSDV